MHDDKGLAGRLRTYLIEVAGSSDDVTEEAVGTCDGARSALSA